MASAAAAEEEHGPVYVGAGVWLRERDGRVVVGGVAAGGGASQSGLVGEGDEVRMVDHVPVDGLGAAAVEEMLVGEEGSVVILTLAKPGDGGALTHATLVRRSSLREREEAARRRKEIYDVGLGLAVPREAGAACGCRCRCRCRRTGRCILGSVVGLAGVSWCQIAARLPVQWLPQAATPAGLPTPTHPVSAGVDWPAPVSPD